MARPPVKVVWTPSPSVKKSALPKRSIHEELESARKHIASDISKFAFNQKRVRNLGGSKITADKGNAVGYWIHRDQRVQDNWAALKAQQLALQNGKPLHFAAALENPSSKSPGATLRNYSFSLKSHEEIAKECQSLNIEFHMLHGEEEQHVRILNWIRKFQIGCLVVDFSPLRPHKRQVDRLLEALGKDGPLMIQVRK